MQLLIKFGKSKTFWFTAALQIAGPYFFTFGNWANVIQWASGFAMAYALWHYFRHQRPQIARIEEMMHKWHLHHLKEENRPTGQ